MASQLEEGVVEAFKAASDYPPGWHRIKLQGRQELLMLHQNRLSQISSLKQGDKIRFRIAKSGPYTDGATYLDQLEKLGKEAIVDG